MSGCQTTDPVDLFIIGGGINGCGIARDAAGRGYSVTLAEMNDLASATSSSSTKLFHGGLRYLEYFEVRLVREALVEREVLLRSMPHISWPMRFILPYHKDMRFEAETPTSKLLSIVMPWTKGRRPAWLTRLGLFMYDHLGGRQILPATTACKLRSTEEGKPLQERFATAYEYSDCWIEDARLVVLNARDAEARGASILPRTKVTHAAPDGELWRIETKDTENGAAQTHHARMLVNAAGPWVGEVIQKTISLPSKEGVRLVRGSHIVTPKLYEHDKCYFFQGSDGRIIFAIPYETDFTLIGTTDAEHQDPSQPPVCSQDERDYLIASANKYFRDRISAEDVVWSYSGIRPLYDDGASSATAATRDYTLKIDAKGGAPVLNIFGGKITTYRRLAESALEKISEHLPGKSGPWTAAVPLAGGDFPVDGFRDQVEKLQDRFSFLGAAWAKRFVRAYGTEAAKLLEPAKTAEDLGQDFGATLTEAGVIWLMEREYARTAEDIVWRRTKLGLRLDAAQIAALDNWMKPRRGQVAAAE